MQNNADIVFQSQGRAGLITLNKQESLNAVTDDMLQRLNAKLDEWEFDDTIQRIIIKAASGRAFSAGGDIRHLYECGLARDYDFDFFAREYVLNARLSAFSKPYIALIDGIVMGGGVGVSFHGSHRIVGNNVTFAMPEVGIGFFPDVGASYLLSRLPGHLGLYLGLTGDRLKQNDCVWSGLASHACASDDLAALEYRLCEEEDMEAVLNEASSTFEQAPMEKLMGHINRVFSKASVLDILSELQQMAEVDDEAGVWAAKTRKILLTKSPTSLEIAFRQINRGAEQSMQDCMKMEYRILRRILPGKDFYEGIRAAIIDKDQNPQWNPEHFADIVPEEIEAHFAHCGEHELVLA